jgi:hypothetical protein
MADDPTETIAMLDPLAHRVAARFLAANSAVFHTVEEIEKAYPYLAGWQFRNMMGRFLKKRPGATVEVKTVAPERWVAVIHGKDWTVEGEQATSEGNAMHKAIKETLKQKK